MKTKYLVITSILALSLTAQSCVFSGGSGPKGVWKSTDGSQSWNKVNLLASEEGAKPTTLLDSVDIRMLVMSPDRFDLLYAASPLGVFASDSAGELWHHVLKNVEVRNLAISESDPQVIYAAGLANETGVVYKSANRGIDWDLKYTEVTQNEVSAIGINSRDHNHVLIGFDSGALMSSVNGGETWSLVRKMPGRIQQIAFHPTDSRRVYLLMRSGGLLVSSDSGNSFTSISANTRRGIEDEFYHEPSTYYSFDFDQGNPNTIYVTTDSGLFRTSNAGVTWTPIRLPVDPANASTLGVEVANGGGTIYVNIDTVIYKSTDGGRTFNTVKLPTDRLIRTITSLRGNPDVVYVGLVQ